MSSDRIIVDAIKVGQNLLRQNLPSTHNLTDAATVVRFRPTFKQSVGTSAELPHNVRAIPKETLTGSNSTKRVSVVRPFYGAFLVGRLTLKSASMLRHTACRGRVRPLWPVQ